MKRLLLSFYRAIVPICVTLLSNLYFVHAQVSDYQFSQTEGVYTEITGAGNITTTSGTLTQDTYNTLINLPFSIPFNGASYNTLTITGDGAIYFNPTIVTSSTSPFNTTARGVIAAFGRDLRGFYNLNHVGSIDTVTQVVAGERVFIIQQKNWSAFAYSNSATSYQILNFQYHLYESGKIQIVYGEFSPAGNSTLTGEAFVGLRGASASDLNTRTNLTTTSFNSSTAGTSSTNPQRFNFTASNVNPGLPLNGLTYTWNPPTCLRPSVTVSSVTSQGATLNISSTQATAINYEIRTSGVAGSGATGLALSSSTTSLTEVISTLSPATAYSVYVQGDCGSDQSSWSTPAVVFTTTCVPETLPLFEGFNDAARPICWSSNIVSSSTLSYLSYPTSGGNPTLTPQEETRMVMYNSYSAPNGHQERLVSPTIDATGIANIMTEFKFYKSNTNSTADSLILQYSIDGGTTWARFGGISRVGPNGWTNQAISLPSSAGNNSNLKIGFLFKSAYGHNMYMDSVVIKEVPLPTYTTVNNFNICTMDTVTATINGINLSNAVVTLNGVTVPVLTNTFTQIRFKVPSGATGTINVTTPLGQFDVTESLTITTPPALELEENTVSVCSASPYIVNLASDLSNYSTYTWNTNTNNTVSGDAATGFTLTTTNGYSFIVTGTTTINGAVCTNKDTLVITSIDLPNLSQNFTTATICDNDQRPLTFEIIQGTITTTSGSIFSGGPNPFSSQYGGLKTQSLYTAADLIQMGWTAGNPITAITINVVTANPAALNNFRVRMGTTANTVMTTTFVSTNLGVVYEGTYQPTVGLNTITFETPYVWDGTSNVVLEFAHNNANSGSGTPQTTIQNISTTNNMSAHYYTDGVTVANTQSAIYDRATASSTIARRILLTFIAETPLVPVTEELAITWAGANLYLDAEGVAPYANEEIQSLYYIPQNNTVDNITVSVTNEANCTRVLTYAITVNPTFETTLEQQACNYYEYRGNILSTSGSYRDTLSSISGCDSVVVLNLEITNTTNNYISHTACGTYNFNDQNYTNSGIYEGVFQTATGCDSTVVLNLTIVNAVSAYITYSGDTLFAHPSFENVTYQWENCATGQIIPGANNATFIPPTYGTYRVRVATGTCSGVSLCAIYGNAGITLLDGIELQVYPNPTKNNVTISYNSEETFNVVIIDATGKEIQSMPIHSGSQVDISNFENGVYIFKIGDATSTSVVRVIKQ